MKDGYPKPCMASEKFYRTFPNAAENNWFLPITGQVIGTSTPGCYRVKWDHLKTPVVLHESFFEFDHSPSGTSEIVMRRFGRHHEQPCGRPDVLTCALWECQVRNRCVDLPLVAVVPPSEEEHPNERC